MTEAVPVVSPVTIDRIDHVVLTVADVDQTMKFYTDVLGMRPVNFGAGRRALCFGNQKLNIHLVGHEWEPKADQPTPGSIDLCLITSTSLDQVMIHLQAFNIAVEEGPVVRTGATGPITSVYFRDPDANLIEVSTTTTRPATLSNGGEEAKGTRPVLPGSRLPPPAGPPPDARRAPTMTSGPLPPPCHAAPGRVPCKTRRRSSRLEALPDGQADLTRPHRPLWTCRQ